MNRLGWPLRRDHSFKTDDRGENLWESSHDPTTQTIVIKYSLGLFGKRREIDVLTSALAGDLHGLAARLHPNRRDEG